MRNPTRNHVSPSCSTHFNPIILLKCHDPSFPIHSKKPRRISLQFLCSSQPSGNSNSSSDQHSTLFSILKAIPDWADMIKERGMVQKRSLYDHEKWVQHRSSSRHVRHFLSSLSSRVILSLVPPVIVFTSFAVIIASYNTAVYMGWLPEFFPILRAPSLPYQLTAPALALLLVFRTEASYSRYEEGKKAWTKVIAGTNDLARQVIASVSSPSDVLLKKAILHYIMAFPVALKCHIIYQSDIDKDLRNLLPTDDLAIVLGSNHRPRCIIELISQSLQLLDIEDSKRHCLETKLSCFHEGIEICEQLVGIPIPLSYTRLTSRFLVLWHFTLPIILWDDCHWIIVPATFISAASLFCIEEVGVLIEEPFPMLALDELCHMTHRSIKDVMRNEELIQDHVHAKKTIRLNKQVLNGSITSSLEGREPG
ncbi:voltage-dependent chloride channel 1, chloroplastic-like isoform X1 [Primulina tabacum]|uniref:voltage-dependent chloride channel 1, chloroplastic-like isoform X1 n=1 Tax=Primulina tabacum TaxID=48773 RepID=UPI003F590615